MLNDGTPVPPIAWFPVNRLFGDRRRESRIRCGEEEELAVERTAERELYTVSGAAHRLVAGKAVGREGKGIQVRVDGSAPRGPGIHPRD